MIEIKKVNKTIKNKIILEDISLKVFHGQIQAVVGVNGAGKSTLLNILCGFDYKNSGDILFGGSLIKPDDYKHKKNIGCVIDKDIFLEKLTIIEYLVLLGEMFGVPKSVYISNMNELITYFSLEEAKDQYIESLSKGMKKKVSLIAALFHNPKYLILDEPFDNLDFITIKKLLSKLKELKSKGVTILVVAHQVDLLFEFVDNVALLNNGILIFNKSLSYFKSGYLSGSSKELDTFKTYVESLIKDVHAEYNK